MVDLLKGWFNLSIERNSQYVFVTYNFIQRFWLDIYFQKRLVENKRMYIWVPGIVWQYWLEQCPTSSWNPQSNAIPKRIHQVLASNLGLFNLDEQALNKNNNDLSEKCTCLVAVFVIQYSFHHQRHGFLLGQLVFGQDIIMSVNIKIDWKKKKRKKAHQDERET